jgi:hypothetical protein
MKVSGSRIILPEMLSTFPLDASCLTTVAVRFVFGKLMKIQAQKKSAIKS